MELMSSSDTTTTNESLYITTIDSLTYHIAAKWIHCTYATIVSPSLNPTISGVSELFDWVFFNQSYSKNFPPFTFVRGQNTSKVVLAGYITGARALPDPNPGSY